MEGCDPGRLGTYLSSPLAFLTLFSWLPFTTLRGHRGKSRRNIFQDRGNRSNSKKHPHLGAGHLAADPHCDSVPMLCSLKQNLTSWLVVLVCVMDTAS